MLADNPHHSTELENPQNDYLDSLFLGSFDFMWWLYTTCIYMTKTTTKANQNGSIKPTASPLHAVQSMNKTKRHGYIQTLHQTLCLHICPWHYDSSSHEEQHHTAFWLEPDSLLYKLSKMSSSQILKALHVSLSSLVLLRPSVKNMKRLYSTI